MKKFPSFIFLLCLAFLLFALSVGHADDPNLNLITGRSSEHILGWYGSVFVDLITQSVGFFAGITLLICLFYASLFHVLKGRWQRRFLILSFLFVPIDSLIGMSVFGEENTFTHVLFPFDFVDQNRIFGTVLFILVFVILFYNSGLFKKGGKGKKKERRLHNVSRPQEQKTQTPPAESMKKDVNVFASSKKSLINRQSFQPRHHSKKQLRANVMAVVQSGKKMFPVKKHTPSLPKITPSPREKAIFSAKNVPPLEQTMPPIEKMPPPVILKEEKEDTFKMPLTSSYDQLEQTFKTPECFKTAGFYTPQIEELEDPESQSIIEETLKEFGSPGVVIRASRGPFVTLYEVRPAHGVKASKIIALAEELSLSLRKSGVRLSIIPEKDVVGVEVPNEKSEIVPFGSLVNTSLSKKADMSLPITLGVNISGEVRLMDLAKAPHLLVAGTTGSGKSIGLHTLIVSLLVHHPWWKCRFVMVDPKVLELSVYNDIPHLLSPVINDMKKAVGVLDWLVGEMENRYHAISLAGARNIDSYNALSKTKKHDPLPFIVVIIDEMADLMIIAGKEVESRIQRLAQMARAAGIHLVMATQRPSVDVITGVIKANFPARIAFRVNSKIDSHTILGGEGGAEMLIGKGDMLAMFSDGKIQRLHGAFIPEEAVEDIVQWAKEQAPPQYVEALIRQKEEKKEPEEKGENVDELYQQALDILSTDGRVSVSYLQRKMQIGYNRSARLVDMMEERGIVSAPDKVGKRTIL